MGVRPHVAIVGAGFGGLAVARSLDRHPVEVTLIDRNNFTTFQPLLYQVATAGLNAADVAHPIRGLFHRQRNLRVLMGEVTGVDWSARGPAGGAPTGAVRPPGAGDGCRRHVVRRSGRPSTPSLYTLEDAVEVRNHVVSPRPPMPTRRSSTAASSTSSWSAAVPRVWRWRGRSPSSSPSCSSVTTRPSASVGQVVLVETRDRLLEPFHGSSQRAALDALGSPGRGPARRDRGRGDPDHVRFTSGEVLQARTVIWAAGVRAHPVARAMGLPTTASGRVEVAADLSVPARAAVGPWAASGPWAMSPPHARRGSGGVLPQLAPVAMQSGAHVARQIGRLAEGKPTQPFRFHDKGTMATIGRRAAIAELPGRIRLHGTLAWLAWLGLHILYLAGVRNRASVLLNWAWGYFTWDRGPRIILRRGHPDWP